ncbi:hypothetical protein TRV_05460 [Trichophyton verrucosum HKI 0517]|uniref:Uncharacterized protein n=1 Tax=Trichophyton verrucosum (strain HKI 0517) TaxID=663202 RepID=D4DE93_TRIVH|nr:uncharacterized protein TRV_05460 [Trichophyton verrucosum HKI 0517]EFE39822.1 hypothetical protein TRV_05460 [Trichophyton verrucosum HKI 0517]
MFPNDEQENERLDIHHALIDTLLHGRLHIAPISKDPQRVLDLCTGTGIVRASTYMSYNQLFAFTNPSSQWAISFGNITPLPPLSNGSGYGLTGLSIKPMNTHQLRERSKPYSTFSVCISIPTPSSISRLHADSVPPNLKFIVDDVEDEWGYEGSPFDYIHGRFLIASIRDWPRLIKQAFTPRLTKQTSSCTKPGGWVEFQDWDGTIRSDDDTLKGTHLFQLQETVKEAFIEMGINANPGAECGSWLKDAGFINITTQDKHLKTVGAYNLLQHTKGLGGIANLPLIKKGWQPEEIEVLLSKTREDLRNRSIHAYFNL